MFRNLIVYSNFSNKISIYGDIDDTVGLENILYDVDFMSCYNKWLTTIKNGKIYQYSLYKKRNLPRIPILQWIFPLGKTVSQIVCGCDHTMILTDNGEVYGWGMNYYGQIYNCTIVRVSKPVYLTNYVKFIACGNTNSLLTFSKKTIITGYGELQMCVSIAILQTDVIIVYSDGIYKIEVDTALLSRIAFEIPVKQMCYSHNKILYIQDLENNIYKLSMKSSTYRYIGNAEINKMLSRDITDTSIFIAGENGDIHAFGGILCWSSKHRIGTIENISLFGTGARIRWSPERHKFYTENIRNSITMLLNCIHSIKIFVPKVIIKKIFSYL